MRTGKRGQSTDAPLSSRPGVRVQESVRVSVKCVCRRLALPPQASKPRPPEGGQGKAFESEVFVLNLSERSRRGLILTSQGQQDIPWTFCRLEGERHW